MHVFALVRHPLPLLQRTLKDGLRKRDGLGLLVRGCVCSSVGRGLLFVYSLGSGYMTVAVIGTQRIFRQSFASPTKYAVLLRARHHIWRGSEVHLAATPLWSKFTVHVEPVRASGRIARDHRPSGSYIPRP